ncbi:hypothetical protein ACP90_18470 [Labrenzia sp. CP4]|jgi:hypothetical protein|nr:hypothetical protein ACP90_18470 [Labrenzia sp. CP4]
MVAIEKEMADAACAAASSTVQPQKLALPEAQQSRRLTPPRYHLPQLPAFSDQGRATNGQA